MIKYIIDYNRAMYGVFDTPEAACDFALTKFEYQEWEVFDIRIVEPVEASSPEVTKHVIVCDELVYGVFNTAGKAVDFAIKNFKGMRWKLRYLNLAPF